jgi:hypothetical protein
MNRTREKKMFKQDSYYLPDHGDVVDHFSLDEYIHKYKDFLIDNPWAWEAESQLTNWELNADKDRLELTYTVELNGEIETHVDYVDYQKVTTYITAV